MPSTRPKDKYGAQMIILFAPDPDIRENAGMLLRGLNPLGWSDQGKSSQYLCDRVEPSASGHAASRCRSRG